MSERPILVGKAEAPQQGREQRVAVERLRPFDVHGDAVRREAFAAQVHVRRQVAQGDEDVSGRDSFHEERLDLPGDHAGLADNARGLETTEPAGFRRLPDLFYRPEKLAFEVSEPGGRAPGGAPPGKGAYPLTNAPKGGARPSGGGVHS